MKSEKERWAWTWDEEGEQSVGLLRFGSLSWEAGEGGKEIPEGISCTIVEVKKALLITDQEVPSIEENVPRPEDIFQQLPPGQLWCPSIAQERGLLAHWGHQ